MIFFSQKIVDLTLSTPTREEFILDSTSVVPSKSSRGRGRPKIQKGALKLYYAIN